MTAVLPYSRLLLARGLEWSRSGYVNRPKNFAKNALSVGSWEGCLSHAQNIVYVHSVALELAK